MTTSGAEVILPKPTPSFVSLGLNRWLVDSLAAMAMRKPTPIQAACIGPILEGVLYCFSSQCHLHSGLYILKEVRLTTALQDRIAYRKVSIGRDCIGGSSTGSGKTVAFAAPILQKWAEDPYGVFALILTPTR